ncbi:MAG: hypothetical protein ACNFW9_02400 [Candidatus Kerfeldbacteria bacterium]
MSDYSKGDVVDEAGKYVCVPCGFHHEYKIGDVFGECTSCLAGSKDGHEDYVEGTGIWEKETSKQT